MMGHKRKEINDKQMKDREYIENRYIDYRMIGHRYQMIDNRYIHICIVDRQRMIEDPLIWKF